ncbi:MAG: Gfo/Idh/MocA family oxidoreductase [Phycisphaerae bacterium]
MSQACNVALIGQKFMGRVHSNAFLKVGRFFNLPLTPVMHTITGLDLIALAPFADRWGWKKYSTAWKDVVKDPAIQLVDICTPHYMHAEQALAAIAAGKHVACEKPLAATLKDARNMRNAAVRSRRSKTFAWFSFRRCPAVALAYQVLREGRLGRLYHVHAQYFQSWGGPTTPLSWRFQKKYAGSGAHGDLSSHLIDLTRFLTGHEFHEVTGALADTLIPERELTEAAAKQTGKQILPNRPRPKGKCDVDDSAMFLAKLAGGLSASYMVTRVGTGHSNSLAIELSGERGAIRFALSDLNTLWLYDNGESPRLAGWRRIQCTTAGQHPYVGAWWPEGHLLGYEHTFVNMLADMIAVIAGEEPLLPLPDFADAYETQRVLEAVLLSAKHRAAVKLNEIK